MPCCFLPGFEIWTTLAIFGNLSVESENERAILQAVYFNIFVDISYHYIQLTMLCGEIAY